MSNEELKSTELKLNPQVCQFRLQELLALSHMPSPNWFGMPWGPRRFGEGSYYRNPPPNNLSPLAIAILQHLATTYYISGYCVIRVGGFRSRNILEVTVFYPERPEKRLSIPLIEPDSPYCSLIIDNIAQVISQFKPQSINAPMGYKIGKIRRIRRRIRANRNWDLIRHFAHTHRLRQQIPLLPGVGVEFQQAWTRFTLAQDTPDDSD